MTQVRSSLIFSVLASQSVQIISLISTVVIARLLTPSEVGVYAIASSISILAIELRSLGVAQFIIREKTLDDEKIRRAIGVMILISWGLGIVLSAIAPFTEDFYGEPDLPYLLLIIAVTFLLSPFASVPYALLLRDMNFKAVFFIMVGSSLVTTSTSIGLVLAGYSYYGLAFGLMAGSISEFLIINIFAPKGTPWKPSFRNMGELMKFGTLVSLSQLFTRFSESISDLVVGKAGSMRDAGLFSRGLGLILFANNVIVQAAGSLVLPLLSNINRTGKSVSDAYLRVISLQSAFSLPILAVIHVSAAPIIRIMFGDQWDSAIPIASTLALWAMLQAVHSFSDSTFLAIGKEKLMFLTSLAVFTARISLVLIAAFAMTEFALINVAWALVISGTIELVIKTVSIKLGTGVSIAAMIKRLVPTLLTTLICWSSALILDNTLNFQTVSAWLAFGYLAGLMPIIWIASLIITKHELWPVLRDMLLDIKAKFKRSSVQDVSHSNHEENS